MDYHLLPIRCGVPFLGRWWAAAFVVLRILEFLFINEFLKEKLNKKILKEKLGCLCQDTDG